MKKVGALGVERMATPSINICVYGGPNCDFVSPRGQDKVRPARVYLTSL